MRLLTLPSPLLPPGAYEPLAEALNRRGHETAVADPVGAESGQKLVHRWAAVTRAKGPSALLAHSNAGYLAPGVRAAVGERLPIVFMDAALPPEDGPTRLAPERFRAHLRSLVMDDSGMLPPWTRWWPREAMQEVVPAHLFDGIDEACPQLSLSYFDTEVTAPVGWSLEPNAYLAFGETYADEVARAHSHLWPTIEHGGTHLQFLWEPDVVARLIDELFDHFPQL